MNNDKKPFSARYDTTMADVENIKPVHPWIFSWFHGNLFRNMQNQFGIFANPILVNENNSYANFAGKYKCWYTVELFSCRQYKLKKAARKSSDKNVNIV